MKLRSKFNHDFTNRDCLHYPVLKAYKARDNLSNFSFKMFKSRFSGFRKCLEQPVELTQKKQQREKHHIHDSHSYLVIIVVHYCGVIIESL